MQPARSDVRGYKRMALTASTTAAATATSLYKRAQGRFSLLLGHVAVQSAHTAAAVQALHLPLATLASCSLATAAVAAVGIVLGEHFGHDPYGADGVAEHEHWHHS